MDFVAEYLANRGVWDLNELVNMWETYVCDPFEPQFFRTLTFTSGEVAAVGQVHSAWLAFATVTPPNIKDEVQAADTSVATPGRGVSQGVEHVLRARQAC